MAGLLVMHHLVRTFNPNFALERDEECWSQAVAAAGRRVLDAGQGGLERTAYEQLLWETAATISGGHTLILGSDRSVPAPFLAGDRAPEAWLEWTPAGIAVGWAARSSGLLASDVIVRVDGEDADRRYERYEEFLRVYPRDSARFHAARWLLAGPADRPLEVAVEWHGHGQIVVEAARTVDAWQLPLGHVYRERQSAFVCERDGQRIGYLDLGRLDAQQLHQRLDAYTAADALVLDMRGYPSGAFAVLERFFPALEAVPPLVLRRPLLAAPVGWRGRRSGWLEDVEDIAGGLGEVEGSLFAGPITVFCHGGTASDAEWLVDMFQASGRAQVVGTGSKGAAGAPTWCELAETGCMLQFSASLAFSRGRESIEGIGLTPDLVAWPTLQGLRAGRDEVLEAALALLSGA